MYFRPFQLSGGMLNGLGGLAVCFGSGSLMYLQLDSDWSCDSEQLKQLEVSQASLSFYVISGPVHLAVHIG